MCYSSIGMIQCTRDDLNHFPCLPPAANVRFREASQSASSSTRPARFALARPPSAGPLLLPAHHRVERADGGAGNERHVFNVFAQNALRIGDGAAQPSRDEDRRRGSYRSKARAGVGPEQEQCEIVR
jgi:hypothetical protein